MSQAQRMPRQRIRRLIGETPYAFRFAGIIWSKRSHGLHLCCLGHGVFGKPIPRRHIGYYYYRRQMTEKVHNIFSFVKCSHDIELIQEDLFPKK